MPATPENREKLQEWIEEKYASSAFNQCSHQELPLVTGLPPLRLHVDPNKTPVATHTPMSIHTHPLAEAGQGGARQGLQARSPGARPTGGTCVLVLEDGNLP